MRQYHNIGYEPGTILKGQNCQDKTAYQSTKYRVIADNILDQKNYYKVNATMLPWGNEEQEKRNEPIPDAKDSIYGKSINAMIAKYQGAEDSCGYKHNHIYALSIEKKMTQVGDTEHHVPMLHVTNLNAIKDGTLPTIYQSDYSFLNYWKVVDGFISTHTLAVAYKDNSTLVSQEWFAGSEGAAMQG